MKSLKNNKTGKTPIAKVDSGYRDLRGKIIGDSLVYRPTWAALAFPASLLTVGIFTAALPTLSYLQTNEVNDSFFLFIFSFVFIIMGVLFLTLALSPVIFNKTTGEFTKSTRFSKNSLRVPLSEIKGIQLLSKTVRFSDPTNKGFTCYEMNLILDDTDRINILSHGNFQAILEDANILAEFLGVPIHNETLNVNKK